MSVFSKARELADELVASEESCRLADAKALADDGLISENELNSAVNDYNSLINKAIDIVRMGAGVYEGCGNCGRGCKKG